MALKSQFGSGGGSGGPFGLDGPAPHHSSGHSLLHNLLADAIDTAKGIPFGLVQTVEHPVKVAKAFGSSYKSTYGHGFHHFLHEFHAHPLQPLLDAISVPLILAGGAGFAIKGASTAAEIGRAGELGSAWAKGMEEMSAASKAGDFAKVEQIRTGLSRHPALYKASLRFKKGTSATTRQVETGMPGLTLSKAYSSNLFRRALTKGTDSVIEALGNKRPGSYFSTEGLGQRMLAKDLSKRSAATAARAFGQASVYREAEKGFKKGKGDLAPHEVGNRVGGNFDRVYLENAHKVDASRRAELAASKNFNDQFEFVQQGPGNDFASSTHALEGYSKDQVKNHIKTMGKRIKTTQDPTKAWVHKGQVYVVRKGLGDTMVRDIEKSRELAQLIYRAPLTAWKGFILSAAPRYFVNNVIGNAGMYAAATNPVEFTRGVVEAMKASRGIRASARFEKDAGNHLDALMNKYLPNEWVHENVGYMQHGALGVDQTIGARAGGPFKRAAHGRLYTATEKVSYRGPQRASLMGALHSDETFRDLYRANRKKGMDEGAAYQDAASSIVRNPVKAAALEKRVADWAGQYYHLNSLEKAITAFVPFYNWDRHALRFGKEQVLSRPLRTVVLAQMGALGDAQASKELGKIPDFMKGAIPVPGGDHGILGLLLGQRIKGRQKVILTAGYNPLAAAADDADALAALVGQGPRSPGEAIGGQLNPVISGFISGVTGQQLFSGAKAQTHGLGPLGGAYEETFGQLPHAKLTRAYISGSPSDKTSKGTPTLYKKDVRQIWSSLFGLNERDFSPVAAKRLYDQQHHIKKGRRHARRQAQGLKSNLKSNL